MECTPFWSLRCVVYSSRIGGHDEFYDIPFGKRTALLIVQLVHGDGRVIISEPELR